MVRRDAQKKKHKNTIQESIFFYSLSLSFFSLFFGGPSLKRFQLEWVWIETSNSDTIGNTIWKGYIYIHSTVGVITRRKREKRLWSPYSIVRTSRIFSNSFSSSHSGHIFTAICKVAAHLEEIFRFVRPSEFSFYSQFMFHARKTWPFLRNHLGIRGISDRQQSY